MGVCKICGKFKIITKDKICYDCAVGHLYEELTKDKKIDV